MRSAQFSLGLSLALLAVVGCTKQDSSGSLEDLVSSTGEPKAFRTSCNTVFKGKEENPIDAGDAKRAVATVVGPNLISLATKNGPLLVKLHGLDVPKDTAAKAAAEAWLGTLVSEGDVYFYPAEPDCTAILDDGTEGAVGAVFSGKGRSFAETLLKKGLGNPTTDVCQGKLISSCYNALNEQVTPTPTPVAASASGVGSAAGFMLWKPISASTGKLAVHSLPYGTNVVVDGETGRNQGGGNGYGSLARFKKAGCSYGKNVKLQLELSDGSNYMFGTKDYAVIPDGCQRWLVDKNGKASINKK